MPTKNHTSRCHTDLLEWPHTQRHAQAEAILHVCEYTEDLELSYTTQGMEGGINTLQK